MANIARRYDLAVVGAGSAAEAAAAEARRRGKSVVLVERGVVGGTCPSVGCVPSKFLLAAAEVRATAAGRRFPGIDTSAGIVDLERLVADKDRMLADIRQRDHVERLRAADVPIVKGSAALEPSEGLPTLTVTEPDGTQSTIVADHVILATGAQPFVPDIPGLRDVDYLTYATAMSLRSVPDSLLVVGGNAVGLEQAQLFARLGAEVTVVEIAPRIAPNEDPDVSKALEDALAGEGIRFLTDMALTRVKGTCDGISATVSGGEKTLTIGAEKLLIATGRRPATDGLNLAAAGVVTGQRGEVLVDGGLRTANPRVWAAGDVTGQAQFVYVAQAQGVTAAANALGARQDSLDYSNLPRVMFTSPAVAAVGMTASAAEAAGLDSESRTLLLPLVPRALLERRTDGVLKLVSESATQRILGVHMAGDDAGDVIAAATYAMGAGLTVPQLAQIWSPAFTMAESLKIAAQLSPSVAPSNYAAQRQNASR
jgi:mercuric reductase